MIFSLVANIITIAWVVICLYLLINACTIGSLKDSVPLAASEEPGVDIVIAVRNEEADGESLTKYSSSALQTLFAKQ